MIPGIDITLLQDVFKSVLHSPRYFPIMMINAFQDNHCGKPNQFVLIYDYDALSTRG